MNDTPAAGHNLPDLAATLHPDAIAELIANELRPLRERADVLVGSCRRFMETYPVIDTSEADAKAAEVLAVCQRFTNPSSGRVETARVALKAPILAADSAIGSLKKGPFARVVDPVIAAAAVVSRASIAYKQKIEREARETAEREAQERRAQAEMAERLATNGSGLVTMEDAAQAHQAADDYQAIADSKASDLTRTHGNDVGTTSLRYRRVVTIVSPADVPRIYCVPDLAAITRAAGKAGTPIPAIAGCTIVDEPDLTVRR